MSPQQQFELAKQVAISNPSRLQAVLRGQPDPVFSDLNIAMMALRGAADLRKSMEGAQAAQQTQQPSVKDQMVAQMDQETAQLGGVANLQAPNMAIPNGGVAGEEEPPVVQAAGGGAVKRFNGQFGSEVPESTIGRWYRNLPMNRAFTYSQSPGFQQDAEKLAELTRKREELIIPPWEAVTPARRKERETQLAEVEKGIQQIRGKRQKESAAPVSLTPAAELSPSNIGGADVSGGMYESVFSRLEPKAGSAQFPSSSSLVSPTAPPLAPRAAPEAASKAAPIVAAAPQKDGIASLRGDPKSVFADIDSIPDPAKREEVRRAYMEQLRTQGVLQEDQPGISALAPRSVKSFLAELADRKSAEAKRIEEEMSPERKAVTDAISRLEGKGEKELASQRETYKGLAALAAAAEFGKGGRGGPESLGAAFGAVGNVGAQLAKLQTATKKDIDKIDLIRAEKALAFKEGDRKLAAELTLKESEIANKMLATEYENAYRTAFIRNQKQGLDDNRAHYQAQEEAERAIRPYRIAKLGAETEYLSRKPTAGVLTPKDKALISDKAADNVKSLMDTPVKIMRLRQQNPEFAKLTDMQMRAALIKQEEAKLLGGFGFSETSAAPSIQIPDSDFAGAGKVYDATK